LRRRKKENEKEKGERRNGDETKGTGGFKLKRRRKCKWDHMMIWREYA
jgi:hypothetical protein